MFMDDVSAVVFDPGHSSFRIGFSGDDAPKIDLPSQFGVQPLLDVQIDSNDNGAYVPYQSVGKDKAYYIGTNALQYPRPNTEIDSFLRDGMIEDWDMFEAVMQYTYNSWLGNAAEFSALFTEPAWNRKDKREKLTELMFEKFQVPAFLLVKSATLATFAAGRTSALVLDSGALQTTAVVVLDGCCIPATVARTPLAGDYVTAGCLHFLRNADVDVVPRYMIKHKECLEGGRQIMWKKRTDLPKVTQSYHDCMVQETVKDLKASTLQVSDSTLELDVVEKYPRVHYEFPNGQGVDLGKERFEIVEALFDTSYVKPAMLPPSIMNVTSVVPTSINLCDNDNRANLYSAVVVTGGNTLLSGFTERLNVEINQRLTTNTKVKLLGAATSSERRFGTWIGGSILGSCLSFQKMWISKQEYDESGRGVVGKKCP